MRLSVLLLILLPALHVCAQKKNADYYFHQGEAAIEDNKYTLALAHLNECLRLDPYYFEAYQLRGAAKERLGDNRGALTDFNIYIESKPDDPEALIGRAVLRYDLGQYGPAKEDFLKLLRTPTKLTSKVLFRQTSEGTDKMFTIQGSNHADFFSYLGLIETKLKNYSQAKVYLDSAIRLSPDEPQYFVNRGIMKEHTQDTLSAIGDYEQAIRIDPSNSAAMHNLAAIRRTKGNQNESEKLLDEAIIQSPSLSAPYAARAFYRYTHKDYEGSLEDYDKVIALNKSDEESWLYRGMVKEKLKDTDGAFIDYTESVTLKNDYARAWMARATLLAKLDRLQEAVEDYTVAILWHPGFGLAYYNRAIAEQKLGKHNEACADLSKAESFGIKTDPSMKAKVCK